MSEIRVTSVVGENGGDRVGLTTGLTVGPLTGTTGIGATISHQGHAQFAGVCTATSFVPTVGQLSHRNLIINGAMQVAQRGTSATGSATSGQFQVDRFQTRADNTDNASFTHAQVTDVPSGTGFSKSFKLSVGTAETTLDANENVYIVQKIEGHNVQQLAYGSSSAQKVTLSFYVKSYQTGNFTIALYKDDSQASVITSTYTVSQSATWEKKTITFDGITTSGIVDDNGNGLAVYWHLAAGSNYTSANSTTWGNYSDARFAFGQAVNFLSSTDNYFQLTGVQLEVGPVATPFEHRSFGDELLRCQRYFFNITGNNGSRSGIPGYANSTSSLRCMVQFPTAMRQLPSLTGTATAMVFDSQDDSASFNCNTLSAGGAPTNSNPTQMCIEANTSGMTNGQGGQLEFRATGSLSFSAEL